ncbi:MAG TPA: fumarylacetoacetate hydrolase family protein [Candidatus Limnocylindria bacterium]|nr:fumarylacetoacetate hydrolase family protein [Candidatus Limnocylindria bacterium]
MRLVTFDPGDGPQAGVVTGDRIIAVRKLLGGSSADGMLELAADPRLIAQIRAALPRAGPGVPLEDARLLAPFPRPRRNVFCVGWNYSEHFAEGMKSRGPDALQQIPEHPALFSKNPATVVGADAPVWHPAPVSEQLDWEAELAVVIGRPGRDIAEANALDHVFGYTIANDVSVRDIQRVWHGGQWFKGKNFDSHLPLGPWIVTADEIADPQALRITSRINGTTKQDSNTRGMVFDVRRIIRELSVGLTLESGDVVITGTPEGAGMGRTPPEWLKVGDVMEMEIERIGVLRNTVAQRSV